MSNPISAKVVIADSQNSQTTEHVLATFGLGLDGTAGEVREVVRKRRSFLAALARNVVITVTAEHDDGSLHQSVATPSLGRADEIGVEMHSGPMLITGSRSEVNEVTPTRPGATRPLTALVPVPSLPMKIKDGDVTRFAVDHDDSPRLNGLPFSEKEAPELAAAILHAAGLRNHLVIDLGGPLPEHFLDNEGHVCVEGYRIDDAIPDSAIVDEIKDRLAVLVGRSVEPVAFAHDPFELNAVEAALLAAMDFEDARVMSVRIMENLADARARAHGQ